MQATKNKINYGFAFSKIINSKSRKLINKNIDLDLDIEEVQNWLGERGIDYDGSFSYGDAMVSEKSRFALAGNYLFVEWYELNSCKEDCYCSHCTTEKPDEVEGYDLKDMYGEVSDSWKADGFEWTKKSILEKAKELKEFDEREH
jgi:hypothetical protein